MQVPIGNEETKKHKEAVIALTLTTFVVIVSSSKILALRQCEGGSSSKA